VRKLAGVISSIIPAPLESLPKILFVADTFCILAKVTASSCIFEVEIASSATVAVPPISATELSSFFVNNLAVSVLRATSPTTKSLALGSLPLAFLSLIVTAICSPP